LGSLKGQDVGKAIVALLIIAGSVAATIAGIAGAQSSAGSWARAVVGFIQQTVLGGGA